MEGIELNNEEKEFNKMLSAQFLKGYDDAGSVYDKENPVNPAWPEHVKAGKRFPESKPKRIY